MISRRSLLSLFAATAVSRNPILSPLLTPICSCSSIPTGSPRLDAVLGGGWHRGRLAQVYGTDAVGLWLLPFHVTEIALQHGMSVSWIAQDRQMIADYISTVRYDVKGANVRLVEKLESALAAIEQAARESDLVVAFAPLAELPIDSQELPCRQVRRLNRVVREAKAAVVIVSDGGEADCGKTAVGRAVRFYAATRVKIDLDYFGEEFMFEVIKNKGGRTS